MFRYVKQEFDVQCSYGQNDDGQTVGDRLNVSSRAHDVIRDSCRKKWDEKIKRDQEMRRRQFDEKRARTQNKLHAFVKDRKNNKINEMNVNVKNEQPNRDDRLNWNDRKIDHEARKQQKVDDSVHRIRKIVTDSEEESAVSMVDIYETHGTLMHTWHTHDT